MAETSYQISEVFILRSREAFISFNIDNSTIFSNEKKSMKRSEVSLF